MDKNKKLGKQRLRRRNHVRNVLRGSATRPRLCVVQRRSNIFPAKLIDDSTGRTLASASTTDKDDSRVAARRAATATPPPKSAKRLPRKPTPRESRKSNWIAATTSTTDVSKHSPTLLAKRVGAVVNSTTRHHGRVPASEIGRHESQIGNSSAEPHGRGFGTISTGSNQNRRRGGKQAEESKDDGLLDRVVKIKRCAAVVKGGRRFSFAAMVVVGDGQGKVGWGYGKANEVPPSVQKATKQATRDMINVPLGRRQHSSPSLGPSFGAAKVTLIPAGAGTGIIAGQAVRAVCEACGIHDILTKSYGPTIP